MRNSSKIRCGLLAVFLIPLVSLAQPESQIPEGDSEGGYGFRKDFQRGQKGEHNFKGKLAKRFEETRQNGGGEGGKLADKFKMLGSLSEAIQDPYQAVSLSILTLKKDASKSGKLEELVVFLEGLLKETSDIKMRNIINFNLAQVFQQLNKGDKVQEISKNIISDNLKSLKKD